MDPVPFAHGRLEVTLEIQNLNRRDFSGSLSTIYLYHALSAANLVTSSNVMSQDERCAERPFRLLVYLSRQATV
jgi:hypothetical protein